MFLYIAIVISTVIALLASVLYYSLEQKSVYKSLKSRNVVITGGSSGIGKGAALEAVRLGANVTIIGRDVEKLKSVVSELTAQCSDTQQKVQYAALDVTSGYQNIEKCLSGIEETMGPIFMLVNCAGMCICGKFEDMKHEDIKQMVDLNYFGTAYATKYILPGMKKRNEGLIVFVASEAAFIGIYGYGAYSAAKWALRGLAETILMELVGTNVRLMLSFPPDTDTPGFQNEELSKPKETKLISSSGGLHSPDDIGKKLIHDAMAGKIYSTYGISGKLLSLMYGGSLESISQILIQIFSLGMLRAVMVSIVLSFHSIVKDVAKERKQEETQKSK